MRVTTGGMRRGRRGLIALPGVVALLALTFLAFGSAQTPEEEGATRPGKVFVARAAGTDPTPVDEITWPGGDSGVNEREFAVTSGRTRFVVRFVYYDEKIPVDVERAIKSAIHTWASLVYSPVEIRVAVEYLRLSPGVLAMAGTGSYVRDFPGAPQPGVYYPPSLADRLSGRDLNPRGLDIYLAFNREVAWYTGSEPVAPADTFDLTTVALQEIAHGLGIADSGGGSDFEGPTVLDTLLRSGEGEVLYRLQAPSEDLYHHFTGGDLYFDGPHIRAIYGEQPVAAFAPPVWMSGSSLSHLDESVFPDGHPDALMTPFLAEREVIREPGRLLVALLQDVGWGIDIGPPATPTPSGTRHSVFVPQFSADGPLPTPPPVPTNIATAPRPLEVGQAEYVGFEGGEVRHATWRFDEYGSLVIVGEIFNGGPNAVYSPTLEVEFYVDGVDFPIGWGYGEALLQYIPSQGDSPFIVSESFFSPARPDRVVLRSVLAYRSTYGGPDFQVSLLGGLLSDIGVVHILGKVRNAEQTTVYGVLVAVALYNTEGYMVELLPGYPRPSNLDAGETGVFEVSANLDASMLNAPTRGWAFPYR